MRRPSTSTRSVRASAFAPSSDTTRPLTRTRPARMNSSALRLEATPARARSFCSRSFGMFGLRFQAMRRVDKPWGYELVWAETERYVGKILHIQVGHKLSRQYHTKKDETFLVLDGVMDLEIGSGADVKTIRMKEKDSFHCTPRTI